MSESDPPHLPPLPVPPPPAAPLAAPGPAGPAGPVARRVYPLGGTGYFQAGAALRRVFTTYVQRWPAIVLCSIVFAGPPMLTGLLIEHHAEQRFEAEAMRWRRANHAGQVTDGFHHASVDLGRARLLRSVTFGFGVLLVSGALSPVVIASIREERLGVREALRRTTSNLGRLLASVLLLGFIGGVLYVGLAWAAARLAGPDPTLVYLAIGAVSTYAALSLCLVVPAAVLERRGPIAALRRGWTLIRGCRSHILALVFYLMFALASIVYVGLQVWSRLDLGPITPLARLASHLLYWVPFFALIPGVGYVYACYMHEQAPVAWADAVFD